MATRNRKKLSADNVALAPSLANRYRIWDTKVPGLFLSVQPSGVKSFNVQWSRIGSKSIGKYPGMTVEAARTKAREVLIDASENGTPEVAKRKATMVTLGDYINKEFEPWASAHQKWGTGAAARIKSVFADNLNKPITDLDAWVIEKWRSCRIKAGVAVATVNRDMATLRSALSKAVAWKIIPVNPLADVKQRKVDNARVRYLDAKEEKRLRAALVQRDRDGIAGRDRGNAHRASRGYELIPALPTGGYCDHLAPMVLLALNTGLRRGELVALEWTEIDIDKKSLHVRAAAAKSGKSRHVPLNKESVAVLTRWQRQQGGKGRVFNVRDVKTAWHALMRDAEIDGFNFHDLRHSFASKLVMAGVDLNTVRELLGHADLKMTLRYSHLAQEHKAAAVAKLVAAK